MIPDGHHETELAGLVIGGRGGMGSDGDRIALLTRCMVGRYGVAWESGEEDHGQDDRHEVRFVGSGAGDPGPDGALLRAWLSLGFLLEDGEQALVLRKGFKQVGPNADQPVHLLGVEKDQQKCIAAGDIEDIPGRRRLTFRGTSCTSSRCRRGRGRCGRPGWDRGGRLAPPSAPRRG